MTGERSPVNTRACSCPTITPATLDTRQVSLVMLESGVRTRVHMRTAPQL